MQHFHGDKGFTIGCLSFNFVFFHRLIAGHPGTLLKWRSCREQHSVHDMNVKCIGFQTNEDARLVAAILSAKDRCPCPGKKDRA